MSEAAFGKVQIHDDVYDVRTMVRLVARQVDLSVRDPWTRAYAAQVVRGGQTLALAGGPSETDQIGRIFWHVKNNITYIQDPRGYEFIPTAKRGIQIGAEDCDGHVVIVCSLLSTLGFATGARVISPDGQNWHIYSVCMFDPMSRPSRYIALDTTQRDSVPGWEPPPAMRRNQIDVTFSDGKAHQSNGREL
jgi:hypothetical protein